ncbi:FAD-dependent oxidoreductase [Paenalkalicoccus suaedae]|uniref:FAD-dependent oxidoreductase n=1 Tax=Paenalkalicoccus suaedae TaxID=2592382 RepID=A0A859FIM4_9BACI|nr:FAD-dependent oxidoreductase [Paenalkalicoccus suaedae]QKS72116.1 FAD-dependent oxidoreductase [Paenalkalicoccus suaedae]
MTQSIIVIGAGLAGLSAATALKNANCHLTMLEAAPQAGGKVKSWISEKDDTYIEEGAQFINTDMTQMVKLATSAGLSIVQTGSKPDGISIAAPEQAPISDELFDHEDELDDIVITRKEEDIPLSSLYNRLDITKDEQQLISSMYGELINVNPQLVSAAGFLSIHKRFASMQDDTTHQVAGPLSHLVGHLLKQLPTVHFSEPARSIFSDEKGVTVQTDKQEYQADGVVIAVPPAVASKLTYSSNLVSHFKQALDSYINGSIIKITWEYETPFWEELKGRDEVIHMAEATFTTPQGISVQDTSARGINNRLTMFIGADLAEELATKKEDDVVRIAEEWLKEAVGERAFTYSRRHVSTWVNDPLCGGGYGAAVRYGSMIAPYELLREPYARTVFASSELTKEFAHHMEGALRAGKYAATSLLSFLKKKG